MERLLRVASPLGLYAEEFDADDRPPPGQLPAGVLAPRADRGGRADHPRRARGGVQRERALRRHRDRQRRRRRHARAPPRARRASASCCSSAATGCRASRRTGRPHDVFVDGRYISPDTWYDADGTPFQPQVHYFVGGATKLYGAALYRLREEDFGELRHHDGISPAWPIGYDELEPYYTQAEQLYQVHGARGEDPTEPPASAPVPVPRGLPRAAHPAALRRPRRGRAAPVPRAVRGHARRVEHALQPLRALQRLRRLPVPRAREVRRRGARRAARARARQRDAADRTRRSCGCRPTRPARTVTGVVVDHDGRQRDRDAPTSWSSRAARRTAPSCCSRRRARRTRTAWRTAPTRSGATTCSTTARRCWRCRASPTRRCSRRRSGVNDFYFAERRLRVPDGQHPDGRQVAGADVPRREAAARRGSRRRGRSRDVAAPRRRLLAVDRGPAAAGQPRHARARRQRSRSATRPPTTPPRSGSTSS